MLRLLVTLLSLITLVGCGGGHNPDLVAADGSDPNQKVGKYNFEVLFGRDQLKYGSGRLQGTGSVRMRDLLSAPRVATNYDLTFRVGPGGSLSLVSNTHRSLDAGIQINISWPANSKKFAVEILTPATRQDISAAFSDLDPVAEHRFSIDVHNDHFQPEVIIWKDDQNEPAIEQSIPGSGAGVNWGFHLDHSILSNVERQLAREQH